MIGDREVSLTAYEFALLYALARAPGRVLPRERMIELIGAESGSGTRAVEAHIARIRQKLGDDPQEPKMLKTVGDEGYVLVA